MVAILQLKASKLIVYFVSFTVVIFTILNNLIESYLSNRFQSVKIDDEKSDKLPVQYAVSQGNVLGSLLFLLYINDLKNLVIAKGTQIILYADDTHIFIACDSLHQANQLSNEVLLHVKEYMYSNLLHINLDKCCFIKQLNRDPLNVTFHASAGHITIIRSDTPDDCNVPRTCMKRYVEWISV